MNWKKSLIVYALAGPQVAEEMEDELDKAYLFARYIRREDLSMHFLLTNTPEALRMIQRILDVYEKDGSDLNGEVWSLERFILTARFHRKGKETLIWEPIRKGGELNGKV